MNPHKFNMFMFKVLCRYNLKKINDCSWYRRLYIIKCFATYWTAQKLIRNWIDRQNRQCHSYWFPPLVQIVHKRISHTLKLIFCPFILLLCTQKTNNIGRKCVIVIPLLKRKMFLLTLNPYLFFFFAQLILVSWAQKIYSKVGH